MWTNQSSHHTGYHKGSTYIDLSNKDSVKIAHTFNGSIFFGQRVKISSKSIAAQYYHSPAKAIAQRPDIYYRRGGKAGRPE